MKYVVIIVSLLVSANSYTQTQTKTMTTEIKRPSIDNKVEHLDIKKYEDKLVRRNPRVGEEVPKYEYKEETPDYTITVEGDYTYGFTYEKKIKSFPYNYLIFKRFYPNFSIWGKFVGAEFNGGATVNLSKRYVFNEDGQLIKEENYDEGWGFSYEQAVKFAQNKYDEDTFKKMRIYKTTENGWKYWSIYTGGDGYGYGIIEHIKLDAQTGKILSYVIKNVPPYGAIKVLKVIVPDKTEKKR